ncbi:hypothetical protein ACWIG4_30400 [Streptomyces sp. NPDC002248]
MATRTRRKPTTRAAKPAPEVAPEEDFDEELVEAEDTEDEAEDDDELEELEEDEAVDTKPAPKKKKATTDVTFGVSDLCALIKSETGNDVTPRELRTLIRKMARDGSGRVNREIKAGNRTRYDWAGPNDPEVRKIVQAYKGGELEADKKEKLQALKDRKAKQQAAKRAEEAEELDGDEEEEEEAPKPRRRAKKAAPAPARRARRKPAPVEEVEDDEELDLDEDDE